MSIAENGFSEKRRMLTDLVNGSKCAIMAKCVNAQARRSLGNKNSLLLSKRLLNLRHHQKARTQPPSRWGSSAGPRVGLRGRRN